MNAFGDASHISVAEWCIKSLLFFKEVMKQVAQADGYATD